MRTFRRRAGQRGSLIVETLVVVPMLIALCGVGFWFWQVHAAQMKVFRDAREPVWATATYACGQAGETSHSYPGPASGASVSGGSPPMVQADLSQVQQSVPGGPNNEVITRSIGTAKATGNDQTGSFQAIWFNPKNTTYTASASMMCNEAVHDGKLDTAKRIAAVAFQP